MPAWRLIETAPAPGAVNMAVDQVLVERVQAGGAPVLRLYRWTPACLSLGRNHSPPGPALARAAAAHGIDVVRRPTGGAAVLHDRELTYSVAVPVGALGSPRETYRTINQALVAGIRRLGVPARVEDEGAARTAIAGPCFQAAAPGEVVVGGRKLVGSAQRRDGRVLLQHGSLLLDGSQDLAAELVGWEDAQATSAITLAEVLDPLPDWSAIVEAIAAGFADVLGTALAPDALSPAEHERTTTLRAHFESDEWMWRR